VRTFEPPTQHKHLKFSGCYLRVSQRHNVCVCFNDNQETSSYATLCVCFLHINLTRCGENWRRSCEDGNELSGFITCVEFLVQLREC
jgi:hypothetical protein